MNNKKITCQIDINANIGDVESKLNTVKNMIGKLTEGGEHPEITKVFSSIEKSIDKVRDKAGQPIDIAGLNSVDKEANNIATQFNKLFKIMQKIKDDSDGELLDLLPADTVEKINSAAAAITKFSSAAKTATAETIELTNARKEQARVEGELNRQIGKKQVADVGAKEMRDKVEATKKLQDQSRLRIKALEEERDQADASIKEINKIYSEMEARGQKVDKRKKVKLSNGIETTLSAENKRSASAKEKLVTEEGIGKGLAEDLGKQEGALKSFEASALKAEGNIAGLKTRFEECKKSVNELETAFKSNSAQNLGVAYSELKKQAESLGISLEDIPLEYTAEGVELLNKRIEEFISSNMSQATDVIDQFGNIVSDANEKIKEVSITTGEARDSIQALDEQAANEKAFADKIKQFVGAAGAAKFFSDALRNAFETVKELDKVMTDMSVVTDLNVGDFWDQMPEYTERANALGVSIKSAYESATLFYQQGLNTNEVIALSNETLKMARIAGLDAAEATNRMTAALRGFNMELNEASAERVADVYSQLAAITASDVDEISTAMTKTASIASSAGMEFETTAAFLSQIIETTRESAETAGTAMKTVIARFQELKKDPSEIGEVDGEIVDANKIETALRTVGVALRDSSGQFRDLDDVFMELSSKWDSLDTNTQRYIATIAAGSRQQSRFIAMMSDYGRTQELVGEAQNSAGASSKQYEKTLDSLESKLTQLENAWNEFTTGIMNSDLVKGAVDFLTNLLNTLNKVTKGFGGVSGMITKIGTALAIFKTAKALIDKFGKSIMKTLQNAGASFGLGFQESLDIVSDGMKKVKNEAKSVSSGSSKKSGEKDKPNKPVDPWWNPNEGKVYGKVNVGFGEGKEKKSLKAENEILNNRINELAKAYGFDISVIDQVTEENKKKFEELVRINTEEAELADKKAAAERKVIEELRERAAAMAATGNYEAADRLYGEASTHETFAKNYEVQASIKRNTINAANEAAGYAAQIKTNNASMEPIDPSKAQIIGRSIGGVLAGPLGAIVGDILVTKVGGPIAESVEALKEYKEVKVTADGIKAATEFGNGTGLGAERQFNIVDKKLTAASVGDDLASALGREGKNIYASAMGFGIRGNEYEQQFFSSGGFNSAQYAGFEAAKAEAAKKGVEFNADAEARKALGPDATQDQIDQFKAMVEQWNAIVSDSVEGFQTANQTVDVINKAMQANAEQAVKNAAEAAGGANTATGKAAAKKARQNTRTHLVVTDKNGNTDPSKVPGKGKGQPKSEKSAKEKVTEQMAKDSKKVVAAEENLQKAREENAKKAMANIEKQEESYKKLTSTISDVGTTLSMVGAGAGMLGSMFESMGLDGVAEGFNTLGTVMSVAGSAISMVSTVMSILTPIMNLASAVTAIQTGATTADTAAKYGNVTATIAETIATQGLVVALGPLAAIFLVIIAAVVALVVVVVLLVKAFKAIAASTPEAKLESAQAAADAAGEAADRAAAAYDNLKDSLQGLDDQYASLENMTKGTREWNDAVNEINQSVLDLIDEYPELAALVQTDTNGVMRLDIESEEVQAVMDKYQGKAQIAKAAEIAAQIDVIEKQRAVDYKGLSHDAKYNDVNGKAIWAGIGAAAAGALVAGTGGAIASGIMAGNAVAEAEGRDETEKAARALARGGIVMEDGQLKVKSQKILDELKLDESVLTQFRGATEEAIKELTKFGQSMEESDAKIVTMFQQMATSALNKVDMSKYSKEQQKQMQTMANDEYAKQFYEAEMKALENADMGKNSEIKQAVARNYGEDATVDGNKIKYFDENGDPKEKELTDEQFKEQYAAMKASEKMSGAISNLPEAIAHASKAATQITGDGKAGKSLAKVFNDKDGKALTQADLKSLESLELSTSTGDLEKDSGTKTKTIWNRLSEQEQEAYGGYAKFVEDLKHGADTAAEAFKKVNDYNTRLGITINDQLNSGAAEAYGKHLMEVSKKTSMWAAQSLNNFTSELTQGMSEEQLNSFYEALNGLDWTSIESINGFSETLEMLGLSLPEDRLEQFTEELKKSSKAITKISLSEFNEQLKTTGQLINKIMKGEIGRKLDEEHYNTIIKLDPSLKEYFTETYDGYIYMGHSLEDLVTSINEANDKVVDSLTSQYKNKNIALDSINKKNGQNMGSVQYNNLSETAEGINQWLGETVQIKTTVSSSNGKSVSTSNYGDNTYINTKEDFRKTQYWEMMKGITVSDLMTFMGQDVKENSFASAFKDYTIESAQSAGSKVYYSYGGAAGGVAKSISGEDFVAMLATDFMKYLHKEGNNERFYRFQDYFGLNSDTSFEADIAKMNNLTKEQQVIYLDSLREDMLNSKADLARFDIDNFTASQDFSLLDEEQVKEIISSLQKIAEEAQTINKQTRQDMKEIQSLIYQQTPISKGITDVNIAITKLIKSDNTIDALELGKIEGIYESIYTQFVNSELFDEQFLQKYADVYSTIIAIPEASIVDASEAGQTDETGAAKDKIDNAYKQYLDYLNSAATIGEQICDAQKRINEELEKQKTSFDYLELISERISSEEHQANLEARRYERKAQYTGVTEDETTAYLQSQANSASFRANTLITANSELLSAITSRLSKKLDENGQETNEFNNAYAKYMAFDKVTGEFIVDWNKVNSELGSNATAMEGFENFRQELISFRDEYQSNQDTIEDIYDEVEELKLFGKEDYLDLFNQLKEGIIQERQEQIDELTTINDSIQEAGSKITDKIQDEIDEQRKIREEEKQESALLDKQAQLDWLKRDTSGANAAQIAKLQKELNDAEQSYQDTLIDNSLQELQKANQQAAEQRQQQIQIAQSQLDLQIEQGSFNSLAQTYLDGLLTGSGNTYDTALAMLQKQAGYEQMMQTEQDEWQTLIDTQIANAATYQNQLVGTDGVINTLNGTVSTIETSISNQETGVIGGLVAVSDDITSIEDIITKIVPEDIKGKVLTDSTVAWSDLAAAVIAMAELQNANTNLSTIDTNKKTMLNEYVTESAFNEQGEGLTGSAKVVKQGGYTSYKAYQQDYMNKKQEETLESGSQYAKDTFNVMGKDGKVDATATKENWIKKTGFRSYEEYSAASKGYTTTIENEQFAAAGQQGNDGWVPVHFSEFAGFGLTGTDSDGQGQTDLGDYNIEIPGDPSGSGKKSSYYVAMQYVANNGLQQKLQELLDSTYDKNIDNSIYKHNLSHAQGIMYDGALYIYHNGNFFRAINETSKQTDRSDFGQPAGTLTHAGQNMELMTDENDPNYRKTFDGMSDSQAVLNAAKDFRNKRKGQALNKYKTGGLADFTGPAWLDGTPSKPEYILNAEQTQAFFKIIDVMGGLKENSTSSSNGDNYFDIDINVESISDDYDVEQMAEKIKEIIYEDSMYRNVNNINQIR